MNRYLKPALFAAVFVGLTLLTQIGGLIFAAAYWIGRRASVGLQQRWLRWCLPVLAFGILYSVMTVLVIPKAAEAFGRVRLPCFQDGNATVVPANWLTCALNRGYVKAELRVVIEALGADISTRFRGSRVTVLEGGFPFVDGFPMLPHLSHKDGRKVDLSFFYKSSDGKRQIGSGSPSLLGYFLYEEPQIGETLSCEGRWTPLRWDFAVFQKLKPEWVIDEERTSWMLHWIVTRDDVSRIFIEPYLARRMGFEGGKVRFQGCHAARHDDHIHVEMR